MDPGTYTAILILGVALGAIPSSELGKLMVAWLAKKLGVKPSDIRQYEQATEDN